MNQALATGAVPGNPIIDLERVNVTFGGEANGTVALAATSLQVETASLPLLSGPFGCGKSDDSEACGQHAN